MGCQPKLSTMSEKKYKWISSVVTARVSRTSTLPDTYHRVKNTLQHYRRPAYYDWQLGSRRYAYDVGRQRRSEEFALTWVSYADKKFWKVEASLDSNKILALPRAREERFNDQGGEPIHEQYDKHCRSRSSRRHRCCVSDGQRQRVEVGYYQAKKLS